MVKWWPARRTARLISARYTLATTLRRTSAYGPLELISTRPVQPVLSRSGMDATTIPSRSASPALQVFRVYSFSIVLRALRIKVVDSRLTMVASSV
jgi:hypothetical protein